MLKSLHHTLEFDVTVRILRPLKYRLKSLPDLIKSGEIKVSGSIAEIYHMALAYLNK